MRRPDDRPVLQVSRPPVEGLTDRELEVLRSVADGLDLAAIARALFLSPHTVKSHAATMRAKLGATTQAHAVAIGFRRGILR